MLESISGEQLIEWIAFYQLEPFGDEWRQTGRICANIVNPYLQKGAKAATDEDFMPLAKRSRQSKADIKHRLLSLAHIHNALLAAKTK